MTDTPTPTRLHIVSGEPTTAPEPRLHHRAAGSEVWLGDCVEVMAGLPADSFDAVITDPPYGLEFMGREWDTFRGSGTVSSNVAEGTDASHPFRDGSTRVRDGDSDMAAFQSWCHDWAEQARRILKPGGHLVAFGGSRTWHRLAAGIEDAGFEIRDSIAWIYSSGFPKGLHVADAIDRMRHDTADVLKFTKWCRETRDRNGVTNRQIDDAFGFVGMAGHWTARSSQPQVPPLEHVPRLLEVLGVTIDEVPDEIRRLIVELNGQKGQPGAAWLERPITGTHEKPAAASAWRERYDDGPAAEARERRSAEPTTEAARAWVDWRTNLKPGFEPIVVARKPLAGTVADNVLRYGVGALNIGATRLAPPAGAVVDDEHGDTIVGRYPPNVVMSHAALLDAETGQVIGDACADGCVDGCQVAALDALGERSGALGNTQWSTGSKIGMTFEGKPNPAGSTGVRDWGGASRFYPVFRYEAKAPTRERPVTVDEHGREIEHPTVKPLALMRWLINLFVPTGARIVEPFAGSGTTVEAALVEGVDCVAVELWPEHLPLIVERLDKDIQPTLFGGLS